MVRSSPHCLAVQLEGAQATVEWSGNEASVAELLQQLVTGGVGLRAFGEKEPTLEDVFMMVTKGLVT